MSKTTKSERIAQLEQIAVDQARAFKIIADRLNSIEVESKWIIHMTGIEKPQLKQLDQDDETAKELLEVDLSSEITGSELCKAMINRGDKIVLCIVKDYEHEDDAYYDAITHCSGKFFESSLSSWNHAVPINNQGEPLTASEVGL